MENNFITSVPDVRGIGNLKWEEDKDENCEAPNNEFVTITPNTPGFYTTMDNVPLIEICHTKVKRARTKFADAIYSAINGPATPHSYHDELDDSAAIYELELLFGDNPSLLPLTVYSKCIPKIAHNWNRLWLITGKRIKDEITEAYCDYKLEMIEAKNSMIDTHNRLEDT